MKSLFAKICIFTSMMVLMFFMESRGQKPLNPVAPIDSSKLVEILYADIHEGFNLSDMQKKIFTGNVRFRHQGVLMSTDKAIQNAMTNTVEAFGNVVINQGDTLTIVGDTLFYDGNTRIAIIRGKNVILRDKNVTLKTKRIVYNIPENEAYYPVYGEIVQDSSLLTSRTGYYDTENKYFKYIGDVKVTHPDFVLETDTMDYDTHSKLAIFKAHTSVKGEKGDLSAEKGWYNIETQESYFTGRSIVENEEYFLSGDTLHYDNQTDFGEGFGNVLYISKKDSLITAGDHLLRIGENGLTRVSGHTISKIFSSKDTTYLVADSILIQEMTGGFEFENDSLQADIGSVLLRPDSLSVGLDSLAKDSLQLPTTNLEINQDSLNADSSLILHDGLMYTDIEMSDIQSDSLSEKGELSREDIRYVIAKGGVKVFRNDFQSLSDSLVYNRMDSTIRYFNDPVLWAENNQLTAESINIYLKNDNINRMEMVKNCFVIQRDTIGNLNQIKGREINAFFDDQTQIEKIEIYGNAESKFFVLDDNQKIVGLNLQQSATMTFLFEDGELTYIKSYTDVDEETVPPREITQGKARFADFNYRISEKPTLESLLKLKHGEKVVNAKLEKEVKKGELLETLEMK